LSYPRPLERVVSTTSAAATQQQRRLRDQLTKQKFDTLNKL